MNAAREPQKKSTKPGRRLTSIAMQSLVVVDTMFDADDPMTVTSRSRQEQMDALTDKINREVILPRVRKNQRIPLARKAASYLLREGLVELGTIDTAGLKGPQKNKPLYAIVVSKDGYSLLEQRCRAMHPSAGGTRRRSQQNENEEVAA